MLLFVYRSIVTVLLVLVMVFIELAAARGVVAFLGYYDLIGLSTFAANLLTTLAIAAATDYAIFLVGRYQEARQHGEDRETAFYTMFHGTAHVILGSGLTIAGATFCLHFTRLPYFQTLGIPLAIGMLVVGARRADPGARRRSPSPAASACWNPSARCKTRGWRRVGTAVVRWPGPILVATIALALVGLLALPGYKTELQRPQLPARRHPGQRGIRGRRPALLAGPDESRTAADRDRSRRAQLRRTCSSSTGSPRASSTCPASPGCRPSPGRWARRSSTRSIPFQISMQGTTQTDEPVLHAGPHGRHAQAGRRDADDHRHDGRRC